ncbi:hypothetical protein F5Y17DRAFT_177962 [Xylariaceae sp. FL0594]|nr:hypothetical protein F5Y17DRAFT_177962 [Xylariaceae sp. FL0594]
MAVGARPDQERLVELHPCTLLLPSTAAGNNMVSGDAASHSSGSEDESKKLAAVREKRRAQNRSAQRSHRDRMKKRLEALERRLETLPQSLTLAPHADFDSMPPEPSVARSANARARSAWTLPAPPNQMVSPETCAGAPQCRSHAATQYGGLEFDLFRTAPACSTPSLNFSLPSCSPTSHCASRNLTPEAIPGLTRWLESEASTSPLDFSAIGLPDMDMDIQGVGPDVQWRSSPSQTQSPASAAVEALQAGSIEEGIEDIVRHIQSAGFPDVDAFATAYYARKTAERLYTIELSRLFEQEARQQLAEKDATLLHGHQAMWRTKLPNLWCLISQLITKPGSRLYANQTDVSRIISLVYESRRQSEREAHGV